MTRKLNRYATPYLMEHGERDACAGCHRELVGLGPSDDYRHGRWTHIYDGDQFAEIGLHTAFPLSRVTDEDEDEDA